jgi:hypothetical protein
MKQNPVQAAVRQVTHGGLHAGGSLRHLVAKYPTANAVMKELVQNGIDMGAKSIVLMIDLDRGLIHYHDNGQGASPEDFQRATDTIGMSVKSGDKYGRFGIGLVSPLSVCERFTFTSAPIGQVYEEWTFDRTAMFAATRSFPIPQRMRKDIGHNDMKTPAYRHATAVWWRTQVVMENITADKVKRKLNLEDLAYEIQSEFSAHMLRLGTVVKLVLIENGTSTEKVVRGKEFEGRALLPFQINSCYTMCGLPIAHQYAKETETQHHKDSGDTHSRRGDYTQTSPLSRYPYSKDHYSCTYPVVLTRRKNKQGDRGSTRMCATYYL